MKINSLITNAVSLRKDGFSLREISEQLKISKSTASLWLRDIEMSEKGKRRIEKLNSDSRKKGRDLIDNRIAKENDDIRSSVKNVFDKSHFSKYNLKVICALLYWCEGEKSEKGSMAFTNADPAMIKYFLSVFRKAFGVNESKFRIMLHIHDYHDPYKQIEFWSRVTKIHKSQFYNPYNKSKGGVRKKKDYQGCVSIRYYDRKVTKEIFYLMNEISK